MDRLTEVPVQHRKKLVVVFASVALLVVLLVAIRWAAPTVIKNYLNDDVLADLGDYRRSRSEEHTSELQSRGQLVCRLLLERNNSSEKHRIECTFPS